MQNGRSGRLTASLMPDADSRIRDHKVITSRTRCRCGHGTPWHLRPRYSVAFAATVLRGIYFPRISSYFFCSCLMYSSALMSGVFQKLSVRLM